MMKIQRESTKRFKLTLLTLTVAVLIGSSSAFSPRLPTVSIGEEALTVLSGHKDEDQEKRRTSKSRPNFLSDGNSKSSKQKFATGKELDILRSELDTYRETLQWSEAIKDKDRIRDLAKAIEKAEARDPDIAYGKALREISDLQKKPNNKDKIENLAKDAEYARSFLSRFKMEGLWVGNYGTQKGLQLINVTYDGDNLIATKVTGDRSVPRGEVSFKADLAPDFNASLPPLKLSLSSLSSGVPRLQRFKGQGQVAEPGFVKSKYLEGQFVISRDCFSFVWVGLPPQTNGTAPFYNRNFFHQVLFRRPTPEQTIRLLRNVVSEEDEIENMRQHLNRCLDLDATECLARHHANGPREPFRRISRQEELNALEKEMQKARNASKRTSSTTPIGDLLKSTSKGSVVDRFLSRVRNPFASKSKFSDNEDAFL